MKTLILVRHGESAWNKLNLFTGWTDVDLTEAGMAEAWEAGKLLVAEGYRPELCFTSYLKRAVKTLNQMLDAMNMDWLPVQKSWRLNEKSYGAIQGLNKADTAAKYGDEQVLLWRRSFDVQPLPSTCTTSAVPAWTLATTKSQTTSSLSPKASKTPSSD